MLLSNLSEGADSENHELKNKLLTANKKLSRARYGIKNALKILEEDTKPSVKKDTCVRKTLEKTFRNIPKARY